MSDSLGTASDDLNLVPVITTGEEFDGYGSYHDNNGNDDDDGDVELLSAGQGIFHSMEPVLTEQRFQTETRPQVEVHRCDKHVRDIKCSVMNPSVCCQVDCTVDSGLYTPNTDRGELRRYTTTSPGEYRSGLPLNQLLGPDFTAIQDLDYRYKPAMYDKNDFILFGGPVGKARQPSAPEYQEMEQSETGTEGRSSEGSAEWERGGGEEEEEGEMGESGVGKDPINISVILVHYSSSVDFRRLYERYSDRTLGWFVRSPQYHNYIGHLIRAAKRLLSTVSKVMRLPIMDDDDRRACTNKITSSLSKPTKAATTDVALMNGFAPVNPRDTGSIQIGIGEEGVEACVLYRHCNGVLSNGVSFRFEAGHFERTRTRTRRGGRGGGGYGKQSFVIWPPFKNAREADYSSQFDSDRIVGTPRGLRREPGVERGQVGGWDGSEGGRVGSVTRYRIVNPFSKGGGVFML